MVVDNYLIIIYSVSNKIKNGITWKQLNCDDIRNKWNYK